MLVTAPIIPVAAKHLHSVTASLATYHMMATRLSIARIVLLAYTAQATHGAHCHSLDSVLAPDAACPRFITMFASPAGLGDQLAHLYTLLAAACQTGRTVVLHNSYGNFSVHQSEGYAREFEYLGASIRTL